MPLVSVVMPVYNAERFLDQAIKSILHQSFKNFEFIIVNDGSEDTSLDIIRSYTKVDNRVRLIDFKANEGSYVRLNHGIKNASAPIILRQDADDISCSMRISKQLKYLEANKKIVCLGTLIKCIDEVNEVIETVATKIQEEWHNQYKTPHQIESTKLTRCPMLHGTAMFRKDDYIKVGGYNEQYITGSDYDFLLKMSNIGMLAKLPEQLYTYRLVSKSLFHRNVTVNLVNSNKIRLKWLKQLFKSNNRKLKDLIIICEREDFDTMLTAYMQEDTQIAGFISDCDLEIYSGVKVYKMNQLKHLPSFDLILVKHPYKDNCTINRLTDCGYEVMKHFIDISG